MINKKLSAETTFQTNTRQNYSGKARSPRKFSNITMPLVFWRANLVFPGSLYLPSLINKRCVILSWIFHRSPIKKPSRHAIFKWYWSLYVPCSRWNMLRRLASRTRKWTRSLACFPTSPTRMIVSTWSSPSTPASYFLVSTLIPSDALLSLNSPFFLSHSWRVLQM